MIAKIQLLFSEIYLTTVASNSTVKVAKSPFTSNNVVACLIPYFCKKGT